MGQIKNIKLHIVTDIKGSRLSPKKQRWPCLTAPRTSPLLLEQHLVLHSNHRPLCDRHSLQPLHWSNNHPFTPPPQAVISKLPPSSSVLELLPSELLDPVLVSERFSEV